LSERAAGRNGDIAFFLYAAPFILNFVYALYLWAGVGFSSVLPQLVYVEVSQSPYIFLLGFAAVALAAVIDFNSEAPTGKRGAVIALSKRLQAVALIAIILSFLAAWYAAGGDIGTALFNMLDGRYPLVFPALLIFFSFMILPAVRLQGANMRNLLVIVLLIASPALLYELGKRNTAAGLGAALLVVLLAAFLLVRERRD
jgi:hypothetical protein